MRIENNTTLTMPSQQVEKPAAKPLQTGDTVKAEVLFVSGGKANIKLDTGELLKGVQLKGVDLKEGDVLELTVSEATKDQITLKLSGHETGAAGAANGSAADALRQMGIEPNERNVMIANLMLQKGMQLTPETFKSAAALLESFPQLSEEQAVFLAQNGIADAGLVEAFVRLVEENALTGSQLDELSQMLLQAAGDGGKLAEALKNTPESVPVALPEVLPEAAAQQAQAARTEGQVQAAGAESAPQTLPQAIRAAMDEAARVSPEAMKLFAENGLSDEAASVALKMADQPENAAKLAQEFVDANLAALPQEIRAEAALTLERAAGFIAFSEAAAMVESAPKDAKGVERMLEEVDRLFARLLPDGKAGEQLQKTAARMQEKLLELRSQIETGNLGGKEALLQKIDQAISQTRLMNDINQYAFVQIPVKLEDRNSTAELYVMKRDRGKKPIDPEDVTMIIALDTQHMGRVESVIKVDKKAVSFHAKVDGEPVAEHLRSGSVKLHTLLKDIGYKLVDLNARTQGFGIDPLNAEKKAEAEYKRPLSLDYKI